MKVLIIEDEQQAARRLGSVIREIKHDAEIIGSADSVASSVAWFNSNASPDLVFMDIQLGDGLCFEIFERVTITCPVIFTTAYDEYALKAFKVNSVDYILKPVDKEDIRKAIEKYEKIFKPTSSSEMKASIDLVMKMLSKQYKERFVIKVGEHLKTIDIQGVQYFYSQDKATFCRTSDNRNHILDYTLEQVESLVDPKLFFRVNRKYLINSSAINDIISFTNSRLKLRLKGSEDDVVVARERVIEFKNWLDR